MNEFDLNRELFRMVIIGNESYKFTILKKCILNCKKQCNLDSTVLLLKSINDIFKNFIAILLDVESDKKDEMDYLSDAFFDIYFSSLKKYHLYTKIDVINLFEREYRKDFQQQILNNWKDINKNDMEGKSFVEVFDDFHQNVLEKYPRIFIKKLGDLKYLYRAQEGYHFNDYNRMIPWPAKTDNRWNPTGETFLYLGYNESKEIYDDTINIIEKTCFEELRLKKDKDVTVCCFKPAFRNQKILNLCYEDLSYDEINYELDKRIQSHVNRGENKIRSKMASGKRFTEESLKKEIHQLTNNPSFKKMNQNNTQIYLGKLFMKGIDEAVFLPISEDDPTRDAYKPFHLLSKYLINKGYVGVIYRSTRMNLIGQQGKNVVLFDNKFANYINNSMHYYHYDGEKYISIRNSTNR